MGSMSSKCNSWSVPEPNALNRYIDQFRRGRVTWVRDGQRMPRNQQGKTVRNFVQKAMVGLAAFLLPVSSAVLAQDNIRVVGSSTVFPFSTAAAEEFGNSSPFKTPIVEATGTGGGLKLFCAGIGANFPDVVNASRRIKRVEVDACNDNGVSDIVEVKIGFDGIVLAAAKGVPAMRLRLRDLYLALAAQVPVPGTEGGEGNMIDNPYRFWSEIDPGLPNLEISVLGPPPTSGTRDAFNAIAIEGGCRSFAGMVALEEKDPYQFLSLCRSVREDGVYVEAGENDNLIVQKIVGNDKAIGIFGYSFLSQNTDILQAFPVSAHGGAFLEPTFDAIADGSYPISRSLFLYAKKAHIGVVPGIQEFIREFITERASGDFGYLLDRGLIPLSEEERSASLSSVNGLLSLELN